jgi:hypothetical protein
MSDSLSDKLFWLVVAVAVLALGGFGWFFAGMTSRPQAQPTVIVASAPPAPAAPAPDMATAEEAAPESSDESPAMQETATEGEMAVAPAAVEEESPYMVPNNKPFITREDFVRKQPAAKPGAKVPKKPGQPLPPGKVPPKTPATAPTISTSPKPGEKKNALALIDHRKVVVLTSGRKIVAMSMVDLGDSYGIKDDKQQMLTVKKDDVTRIEKP